MKSPPVEWIGLAILVIGLSACNCIVGLLPEPSDSHEAEKVTLLYWLSAKAACEHPGSINVGTSNGLFPSCLPTDDSGLIYNVTTASWVSTPSIAGVGDPLQCRLQNHVELWPECGNMWYVYDSPAPPPGAAARLVETQNCIYDGTGNVTGLTTFTGYAAGQTVYCRDQSQRVQRLAIE